MLQRQPVQVRQRVVEFPENVADQVLGELRSFLFEQLAQAVLLDILHQFPPPAGVGILPVVFDPDYMGWLGLLHEAEHVLFGRDALAVHLGDKTGLGLGIEGIDDVEVGFAASGGQGLDHAVIGGQDRRQPAGRLRFLGRGSGRGGRLYAFAYGGSVFAHGGSIFAHSGSVFAHGRPTFAHGGSVFAYGLVALLHRVSLPRVDVCECLRPLRAKESLGELLFFVVPEPNSGQHNRDVVWCARGQCAG